MDSIARAERLIIIGCGTSWHAGLLGEYLFEEYTTIPVEVEYASEFRYRNPVIRIDCRYPSPAALVPYGGTQRMRC